MSVLISKYKKNSNRNAYVCKQIAVFGKQFRCLAD